MAEKPFGQSEAFIRLMTEHQGRLYAFLLSLLGDPDQANDVLQETNVVLWRDSGDFRPGSNFKAWIFRIAHFQFMAHRQRQLRDRLVFDDDVLEVLVPAAKAHDETYEARQRCLTECLEKLAESHRDLLRRRYAENQSLREIAADRGTTPNAVNQALFRIRRSLIACVARTPAGGDS